jgi:hypothetical protein
VINRLSGCSDFTSCRAIRYQYQCNEDYTNVVVIFGFLVLNGKPEPLFPNLGLDMTTTTMAYIFAFTMKPLKRR